MNHIEECADVARCNVIKVLGKGSDKNTGHPVSDATWKEKSVMFHCFKALRHIINGLMVYYKIESDDGEPHFENAHARLSMVLTKLRQR